MSIQLSNRPPLASSDSIRHAYSTKLSIPLTLHDVSPYTRQVFKDESDINTIMSRYVSTGEMPVLNTMYPEYLDVTGIDFHEQMMYVAGAKSMFNELPSSIRTQFDNDPASFVAFCSDDRNRVALAEMGLLSPEATLAALSPPSPSSPTSPPSNPPPAPSDAV
jgi:hypothetical protein